MAVTETVRIKADLDAKGVTRGSNQVVRDMDRVSKASKLAGRAMAGIGFALVAREVLQLGKALAATADEWTNIANRISLYTESAREAEKVQKDLFRLAKVTRADMGATVELWQRLSVANKQLGLDQENLQGVLETLNQTLVISGTSAESAKAGLIQLGQAFASGQLRGEELRSVMEQMPRLTQALAEGLDTDVAGLRAFAEAGELTSARVIAAIQSQAGVIENEFGGMQVTIEQSGTILANAWGQAIDKLNDATGFSNTLATALLGVADAVEAVTDAAEDEDGFFSRLNRFSVGSSIGSAKQAKTGGLEGRGTFDFLDNFGGGAPREPARTPPGLIPALKEALGGLSIGSGIERAGVEAERRRTAEANQAAADRSRAAASAFDIGAQPSRLNALRYDPSSLDFDVGSTSIDEGAMMAQVEQMLGEGSPFQEGLSKAQEQEMALGEIRKRVAASTAEGFTREQILMDQRQAAQRTAQELGGATKEQVEELEQLHAAEQDALITRRIAKEVADANTRSEKELTDARQEEREAMREQRRGLREQRKLYTSMASQISQVNPMLGQLGMTLANLASGGSAAQAATDVMSMAVGHFAAAAQKAANDLKKAKQAVETAQRRADPIATSLVQSLDPAAYEASLGRVNMQINEWFQSLQDQGLGIAGSVNRMFAQIELLEAAGKNIGGRRFREDLGLFTEGIADQDQFVADLANLGVSIQDAISDVLTVEDAFNDVGAAAKRLSREIRGEFDFIEGTLREAARSDLLAAGGDTHEQARIFQALRTDLSRLGAAERTSGRGSVLPAAARAAGGGGAVGAAGGVVVTGPPADVPASDAIQLTPVPLTSMGYDDWSDLFTLDGLTKHQVWANRMIDIHSVPARFAAEGSNWSDLITLSGMSKHQVVASRIMNLWASPARFVAQGSNWSDVVRLEGLSKHQVVASRIMDIIGQPASMMIGETFGPGGFESGGGNNWSDIVTLPASLTKHHVVSSRFMDIIAQDAQFMTLEGGTNWSNIVLLPESLSKHQVDASRFMDIIPMTVDIGDIVHVVGTIDLRHVIRTTEVRETIIQEVTRAVRDRNTTIEDEQSRGFVTGNPQANRNS